MTLIIFWHIGGQLIAEFEISGDDRQEAIENAWTEVERRIEAAGMKKDLDYGLSWEEKK